jgi:hypothetical protein
MNPFWSVVVFLKKSYKQKEKVSELFTHPVYMLSEFCFEVCQVILLF